MLSTKKKCFFYLLALTALFVFFELAVKAATSFFGFADLLFILKRLNVSMTVLSGMVFFLFVQLSLHLLFVCVVWLSVCATVFFFPVFNRCSDRIALILWSMAILSVLIVNQVLYPNSSFSKLTEFFLANRLVVLVFYYSSILFIALASLLIVAYLLRLLTLSYYRAAASLIGIAMMAMGVIYLAKAHQKPVSVKTSQPNIIIIGFDSLRPDFINFFGGKAKTRHMDQFLAGATVFTQSYTPIARTYPSWVSILTGEYPKNLNIRFNLSGQIGFDLTKTLPSILQSHGYHTIYGIDESRFSNIDKQFGFDEIIVPPMGLNDFFLGTINDFPLSNIAMNTIAGSFLFPYSYANRPAYVTYDPRHFLKRIEQAVVAAPEKPLFLTVHLCLTHFPYVWAQYKQTKAYLDAYRDSIERSDQSLADLLAMLEKYHRLENAIVVLLSDHGEALWLSGDRVTNERYFVAGGSRKNQAIPEFYPKARSTEKINESVGHGTDVLGLVQYHTLLAFRSFGAQPQNPKIVNDRVSVMDIMPTLLDYLHIEHATLRGDSLRPLMVGESNFHRQPKDFFMETDFSPAAIRSVCPNMRDVAIQGFNYFEVDPVTGRVTIAKHMGKMIIQSKQLADLYGDWILALYPKSNVERMPVLVNISSGYWTNDLTTPFAKQAPVEHMLSALRQFYGNEIQEIGRFSS